MAYRFDSKEKVRDGVRRIARAQVRSALTQIEREGDGPGVTIHRARQHTKKLRALLRLIREPGGIYRPDNKAMRRAAKALSLQRDVDVSRRTLAGLQSKNPQSITAGTVERLLKRLQAQNSSSLSATTRSQSLRTYTILMREEAERIETWNLDSVTRKNLQRGFGRTWSDARGAMVDAMSEPTDKALHRWRKHVKYHLYHLRLLQALATRDTKLRARQTDRLQQLLGEHHDLAVVNELVASMKSLSKKKREALHEVIRNAAEKRMARAFRLGDELFKERRAPQLWS